MFRLEVATFPVRELREGDVFGWNDGLLTINRAELLDLSLQDSRVAWASVELARPGESVRIVNVYDVWQPMIKVSGPGSTYPAISGRECTTAGRGRTHRLTGIGVLECSAAAPLHGRHRPASARPS